MGVVHLGGKFKTGQGLAEVRLSRANHDKHKGFGVAPQGELKQVGELFIRHAN
jgi:hypothetical protein